MIRLFKHDEVSRYVDNSLYVKAAGANFMMEKAVSRGGFKKVTEEVGASPEEATHICISGASFEPLPPEQNVSAAYSGRYYSHDFVFALEEFPEIQKWVKTATFNLPYGGNPFFEIRRDNLIGMALPTLIQQILKGAAVKPRLEYDDWYTRVGTPSTYHDNYLPFIEWAESLPVEPLIADAREA